MSPWFWVALVLWTLNSVSAAVYIRSLLPWRWNDRRWSAFFARAIVIVVLPHFVTLALVRATLRAERELDARYPGVGPDGPV